MPNKIADGDFFPTRDDLQLSQDLLLNPGTSENPLPAELPEHGVGSAAALQQLAPELLTRAAKLGAADAFAHMDPPTPWVSWVASQWAASVNQNLLHPAVAPAAIDLERRVVQWLCGYFGMNGGHLTPGSTLANLTAIWAARECHQVRQVVTSSAAHYSMAKAAHLLGLEYQTVPVDTHGVLRTEALPSDLSASCLVLTAGTTGAGAIDALGRYNDAAWVHVDAAWGGPLRLSERYADLLAGIEQADSVAVSAHKWLFQPKESALVLFRDAQQAHQAITFDGPYLAAPNIGVLGSHGATAAPLLATLLAWGRQGMAQRIEQCMDNAAKLAQFIDDHPALSLYAPPQSGVVVWRCKEQRQQRGPDIWQRLPEGSTSQTQIDGVRWFRNVAANPNADVAALIKRLAVVLA